MAVLEPAAIRCGLMPEDTWRMTIAEIMAVITERTKEKDSWQTFLDILNGQNCAVNIVAHAPKANPKPRDFMVTERSKRGRVTRE